jgi:hypothetical protein
MRTKRLRRLPQLTPKTALRFLLKSHYLADDFPGVLTTTNFSDYCFNNYNALPSTDELLRRTTLYGLFSVPRTTTTRRVLALPHPASQLALSRIIADNRQEIQRTINNAKISLYNTSAQAGVERVFLGVNFNTRSIKEAELLSRYPVVLKADIANFFHTIYTHSIPWGVLGKEHVKKIREEGSKSQKTALEKHWSSKIDLAVQRGNSKETFGIPVGPDTSRIIAELLLAGVHQTEPFGQLIENRGGYRLVDDFFIGFENEALARQCLEALRRTLWEYNLHLNEDKTKILQSRRVFDTGWKYEIDNFQIPSGSGSKQYEGVARLLDIALKHCDDRGDWVPAIFFCYRILGLEIDNENFRFCLDCMLRVGRDYTTCLEYVVPFLIYYRDRLTGDERQLIHDWGRRILSAHAGRGHDFEIVWILLVCGALGLSVDQSYIGLTDRVLSPLALAVLGLLHADNLLAEVWDDWSTRAAGSGSITSGRLWLPHYEATLRGWTTNQEITQAIRTDAFFIPLLEANITFLDNSDFLSRSLASLPPLRRRRRVFRAVVTRRGLSRSQGISRYE